MRKLMENRRAQDDRLRGLTTEVAKLTAANQQLTQQLTAAQTDGSKAAAANEALTQQLEAARRAPRAASAAVHVAAPATTTVVHAAPAAPAGQSDGADGGTSGSSGEASVPSSVPVPSIAAATVVGEGAPAVTANPPLASKKREREADAAVPESATQVRPQPPSGPPPAAASAVAVSAEEDLKRKILEKKNAAAMQAVVNSVPSVTEPSVPAITRPPPPATGPPPKRGRLIPSQKQAEATAGTDGGEMDAEEQAADSAPTDPNPEVLPPKAAESESLPAAAPIATAPIQQQQQSQVASTRTGGIFSQLGSPQHQGVGTAAGGLGLGVGLGGTKLGAGINPFAAKSQIAPTVPPAPAAAPAAAPGEDGEVLEEAGSSSSNLLPPSSLPLTVTGFAGLSAGTKGPPSSAPFAFIRNVSTLATPAAVASGIIAAPSLNSNIN